MGRGKCNETLFNVLPLQHGPIIYQSLYQSLSQRMTGRTSQQSNILNVWCTKYLDSWGSNGRMNHSLNVYDNLNTEWVQCSWPWWVVRMCWSVWSVEWSAAVSWSGCMQLPAASRVLTASHLQRVLYRAATIDQHGAWWYLKPGFHSNAIACVACVA